MSVRTVGTTNNHTYHHCLLCTKMTDAWANRLTLHLAHVMETLYRRPSVSQHFYRENYQDITLFEIFPNICNIVYKRYLLALPACKMKRLAPCYLLRFNNLILFIDVAALVGFQEMFETESRSSSQGLPYDFRSIMHLRHNAFSRDHSESTVVPRNRTISKTILGCSAKATDLDFLHLNILYCEGKDVKLVYIVTQFVVSYFVQLNPDFSSILSEIKILSGM